MLFRSMDVLKEIGNIGAGNATTAIAGMLGTTMKMEVPRVLLMDATKLGDAICPEEETIVGIFLEVTNDISGSMMFLMKLPAAHFLVNKLMGRPQDYNEPFDEMDLSAMKEIGNIIAGAYLSALSTMTNLKILPSIPYIAVDMAASILSVPAIQFGQYGDNALFIETEFGDDIMMNGYFILMPDFLVRRSEKKGLKRTLILSDILETGQSTATLYRRVAQLVQSRGIDKLIGVGPEISSCAARFDDGIERYFFPNTEALLKSELLKSLHSEVILIKGSRVFNFDLVSEALELKVHETILEVNLGAMVENLNHYQIGRASCRERV